MHQLECDPDTLYFSFYNLSYAFDINELMLQNCFSHLVQSEILGNCEFSSTELVLR